jgi:polar amino acid transport system substrate-binding protein
MSTLSIKYLFVFLTLIAHASFAAEATKQPKEKLVLAVVENSPDTIVSEVILRHAYKKLGYGVEIRRYPAARALSMSNIGEVDGEAMRINGLTDKYPNLIQIYPSICYLDGTAFSMGKTLDVPGWEGLRPYKIGHVLGIKFAETHVQMMQTQVVNNYISLMSILQIGRIDFALAPRIVGKIAAIDAGVPAIDLNPSIEIFKLYHYLHRKHAALVPKISAVLQEMDNNGSLKKINDHVLATILERAKKHLPIFCNDEMTCYEEKLAVD